MCMRGMKMPANITPADDPLVCQCNILRISVRDHGCHEFTEAIQWRSFKKCQISPLTRHHIKRLVKADDILWCDR